MSKHTPGPWVTDGNQHGECHVMDEFGIAIADMAVDYSSIKKIKEHEANARLIAAAPELLEALNTWLAQYSAEEYEDCPEVVQTRAAIARAEAA